ARKKFTGQGSLPTDKEAITAFWRKQVFTWATLIECQLHTGRTHQIRVHFAERHHPLIGDPLYAPKAPRQWPKRLAQFQRQALHAFQLHFVHPVTQEMLRFQSAPPPDMEALLHFLRSTENTP
ncbi:MAG: pseudouridine synthase, partial [Myxococcota bacterium]